MQHEHAPGADRKARPGFSELAVQLAVMRTFKGRILCACPNYTPRDWWECDVWIVNKKRYAFEFEVKLTLHDFKADAEKAHVKSWKDLNEQKHALLGTNARGPSRFYYVVPSALIDKVEPLLPKWAGLQEFVGHNRRLRLRCPAPQRHDSKVSGDEIELARSRMWYRYWALLGRYERLTRKEKP